MGLAQIARDAAYEADAPKRSAEEQRRREQEEHEALVEQQANAMLGKARRKLRRLFNVLNINEWEVIEKHPTYVVLRDPDDEPTITSTKLTLTVTTWDTPGNTSKVLYTPHKDYGKNYTNNRRGDGLDWHCGPEVTDALSLGRALQKHEREVIEMHRSMPDYLP
jgi:hypothetical protein